MQQQQQAAASPTQPPPLLTYHARSRPPSRRHFGTPQSCSRHRISKYSRGRPLTTESVIVVVPYGYETT
ncbi:hypothetical protein I312_100466 [Cryptococcus bacillisporus CA1280]|uniref:uncharacterized protein n=1 Tax=Cryptococcus bacillisporus CA1280 TaxID=1296109 RepID=UPI0033687524